VKIVIACTELHVDDDFAMIAVDMKGGEVPLQSRCAPEGSTKFGSQIFMIFCT
jgi:hypothetical protein